MLHATYKCHGVCRLARHIGQCTSYASYCTVYNRRGAHASHPAYSNSYHASNRCLDEIHILARFWVLQTPQTTSGSTAHPLRTTPTQGLPRITAHHQASQPAKLTHCLSKPRGCMQPAVANIAAAPDAKNPTKFAKPARAVPGPGRPSAQKNPWTMSRAGKPALDSPHACATCS